MVMNVIEPWKYMQAQLLAHGYNFYHESIDSLIIGMSGNHVEIIRQNVSQNEASNIWAYSIHLPRDTNFQKRVQRIPAGVPLSGT